MTGTPPRRAESTFRLFPRVDSAANMDSLAGRFELGPQVGSGGTAEVFRATDHSTGRTVALKRLHANLRDPVGRARFAREARMLAELDHPHVVRYVAHGLDDQGRLCLVTEWLEGETVEALVERGHVGDWSTLRIVQEAAAGLAALHEAGVVHRDVKPANLFLAATPGGASVKIIDLGIAIGATDLALTAQDTVVGSPVYVAPELLRGEEPTAAADVYGLAMVFFELLTDTRPFRGTDTISLLRAVARDPPPRLRSLRPDLPPALDRLIARSLDKLPAGRPARVQELADEAAGIMEVVMTRPDGVPATTLLGRTEQRVRVLLFARAESAGRHGLEKLSASLDVEGARVERDGDRGLVGTFGDLKLRGGEASRAARAAFAAADASLRVAVVSGPTTRGVSAVEGPCVARAGEMLDHAPAGAVMVDEPTAVLLAGEYTLEPARHGLRAQPAERKRPWVAPGGEGSEVADPPGRQREVELVTGLLHDAWMQRTPRVVVLWGDAGIGKSRVGAAVRAQLAGKLRSSEGGGAGLGVLTLRGDAMQATVPLGAVRRAVRAQCGIQDGEDLERQREKIVRAVSVIPGAPSAEFLGELAQVPFPAASSPALRAARSDPDQMRARLRSVATELFRAMSNRVPQLCVLEDLHWLDEATLELFAHLLDALWDHPFAVFALGRPDASTLARAERLWGSLGRTDLRLGPLSPAVCEGVAEEALPRPADAALRAALVARADGNPMFLEELLLAARSGTLAASEGGSAPELPVVARAAAQLRLDGLNTEARRVARAASVFGLTFWRKGLDALLGATPTAVVDRALRDLVDHGFVLPRPSSRVATTTEFVFRHALARDAAYAAIVEHDRLELHAYAARWLASADAASSATLAQHYDLAGQRDDALRQWFRAAREALFDQAHATARDYAALALARSPDPTERRELLCVRAEASFALGDAGNALDDARAAEAVPSASPSERLRVALCVAQAWLLAGRPEAGVAALHAARGGVDRDRVPEGLWVRSAYRLAQLQVFRGRASEALALLRSVADDPRVSREGLHASQGLADAVSAQAALALGDLPAALRACREASARASADGNLGRRLHVAVAESVVLLRLGHTDVAERRLDATREEARRAGIVHAEALAMVYRIEALARSNRRAEAAHTARLAAELAERHALARVATTARMQAAWVVATDPNAADLGSALAWCDAALSAVRHDAPLRCFALAVQATLLRRGEQVDEALFSAEAAMELRSKGVALEMGDAFVDLALAQCRLAAGRTEEADQALIEGWARVRSVARRLDGEAAKRRFFDEVWEHRELLAQALARDVTLPDTRGVQP